MAWQQRRHGWLMWFWSIAMTQTGHKPEQSQELEGTSPKAMLRGWTLFWYYLYNQTVGNDQDWKSNCGYNISLPDILSAQLLGQLVFMLAHNSPNLWPKRKTSCFFWKHWKTSFDSFFHIWPCSAEGGSPSADSWIWTPGRPQPTMSIYMILTCPLM